MKEVFIIGSKGIPAKYGGFETFVEKLTEEKISNEIRYHVACLSNNNDVFYHNNARCFNVNVPNIGPAKAVYYDIVSLRKTVKYIKKNNIKNAVVYILACRIGPFVGFYKKQLNKLGAKLFVNPDGHEWKRAKWNVFIKKYWKISERLMVKNSDLLICDSKNIEKYIKEDYKKYSPKTTFIAYGADTSKSVLEDDDKKLKSWYEKNNLKVKEYYLVVGRFVPENNFKVMITEFMASNTKKDFVLVTNIKHSKFYKELRKETNFDKDKRIKFVGTVYDQELLKKIRENAYAYLHGHEVGGTNPSLLEALATTELNILLNVGFNKEVAEDSALYFDKSKNSLKTIINSLENEKNDHNIAEYSMKAKKRIRDNYTWNLIINSYENLFLQISKDEEKICLQ